MEEHGILKLSEELKQGANLVTEVPINRWDVSRLDDFTLIFCDRPHPTSAYQTGLFNNFNEDISMWDTSSAIVLQC